MKKKPKDESRYKSRLSIEEEVQVHCDDWDQFRVEYAENISEGGVFIKTEKPLSPGTQFRLELKVAGEKLKADAQVIWTKEFPNEPERSSGMGARFINLSEKDRKRIQVIVSKSMKSS
jgi:type IV pilus assembly protein PilZ